MCRSLTIRSLANDKVTGWVFSVVMNPLFFSGQEPSDSVVDGMMSEAPGPLNFTMFLTLFGEKLTGKGKAFMVRSLAVAVL